MIEWMKKISQKSALKFFLIYFLKALFFNEILYNKILLSSNVIDNTVLYDAIYDLYDAILKQFLI